MTRLTRQVVAGVALAVPTLALLVVGPASLDAGAASPSGSVSYPGTLNATDPCTQASLVASGTTKLSITKHSSGAVTVKEAFTGTAATGDGTLSVTFSGDQKFSTPATSYQVAVSGEWTDSSETFTSTGTDTTTAGPRTGPKEGTKPKGDSLSFDSTCG
jgi:hypothetical protein